MQDTDEVYLFVDETRRPDMVMDEVCLFVDDLLYDHHEIIEMLSLVLIGTTTEMS